MLCNAVDNEVIKSRKITTLKAKVNSLEKKIPDASSLIYINQYNADNRNGDIDKEIPDTSCLVTTTFWMQKLVKLRTKFLIILNILLIKNLIS